MKFYKSFIAATLISAMMVTPVFAAPSASATRETTFEIYRLNNMYTKAIKEINGITSTNGNLSADKQAVLTVVVAGKGEKFVTDLKTEENRYMTELTSLLDQSNAKVAAAKADVDKLTVMTNANPALQGTLNAKTQVYQAALAENQELSDSVEYAASQIAAFNQKASAGLAAEVGNQTYLSLLK